MDQGMGLMKMCCGDKMKKSAHYKGCPDGGRYVIEEMTGEALVAAVAQAGPLFF